MKIFKIHSYKIFSMFSLPHKIEIYGFWSNVGSSKSEPTMMTFYIDYIYN